MYKIFRILFIFLNNDHTFLSRMWTSGTFSGFSQCLQLQAFNLTNGRCFGFKLCVRLAQVLH